MKYCFIASKHYYCVAKALQVNSSTLKIWPLAFMCVLCGILALWLPLDYALLFLFNLHFVVLVLLFSSFFSSCFLPSILSSFLEKRDTMQSVRHESRWTLEYKLKYTIKDLYDIYLNISNIVNVIFPHKSKKLEQVFLSWAIVTTMWPDDLFKQRK